MHKTFRWLSIALVFFGLLQSSFFWANSETSIKDSSVYQETKEKAFLHLPSEIYTTGEQIKGKFYCVITGSSLLSPISKVGYLELVDQLNRTVTRSKIILDQGVGNFLIEIPNEINSGKYFVKAYTRWMKNNGHQQVQLHEIIIINPFDEPFFTPEEFAKNKKEVEILVNTISGNIVAGIENECIIKITDKNGYPLKVRAGLYKGTKLIEEIHTNTYGVGGFNFIPEKNNEVYKLTIDSPNVFIKPFKVIDILQEGYHFSLQQSGANISLGIDHTKSITPEKLKLTIQQYGNNYYSTDIDVNADLFDIPLTNLITGLNTIKITRKADNALLGASYWFKPNNKSDAQVIINTTKEVHNTREKVKCTMELPASLDLSDGHFSVSVARIAPSSNMYDYLKITSNFNGNEPGLSKLLLEEERGATLNNYLKSIPIPQLTEGVTLENKSIQHTPEINGQIITGKIMGNDGNPMANNRVYLTFPGNETDIYAANADNTGKIEFVVDKTNDKDVFFVSGDTIQNYSISVYDNFFSDTSFLLPGNIQLDTAYIKLINEYVTAAQMRNLYKREHRTMDLTFQNDSLNDPFFNNYIERVDLSDYILLPTLDEVIYEIVKNVAIRKRNGRNTFVIIDRYNKLLRDPSVFIDGISFFDIDEVLRLQPKHIDYIDVVNSRYNYGNMSFSGIISIKTKSGIPGYMNLPKSALSGQYTFPKKVIYNANDGVLEDMDDRIPDFRTTLYWNPDVQFYNGNASFEFYTSDVNGAFEIVFQGINGNGQIVHQKSTLIVE